MTASPPAAPRDLVTTGWLALVAALWFQLFYACTYGWRFGEYYSYGWYVPPLAALFFFRLRDLWRQGPPPRPVPVRWAVPGLVLLAAMLATLRVLNRVDPRWTLPLWTQAAIVVSVTMVALHQLGGTTALRRFVPVIAFACSAIPLPTMLERRLVSNLTDSVIAASVTLLEWSGQQVQAIGDQIGRMGEIVHVTEGCSGIKSAQSFLMASLFFGEWMTLKPRGRWLMVAAGFATAWTLNVTRATTLTWIRFEHGSEAFDRAHDMAGAIAFAAGSLILLGISRLLDSDRDGRRVVQRTVERRTA